MIEKLTPAQEAMIPEYREMYRQKGLSTTPCDRAKAEAAITASYVYQKMAPPTFIWADSPYEGRKIAAQLVKGNEVVNAAEVEAQAGTSSQGSFDAYWVSFYAFIAEQLPVTKDNLIDIVKDIIDNCGVYWSFEDVVVLTEKPVAIHMKDEKLHNEAGLALEYKDGSGIFSINGVVHPSLLAVTISNAAKDEAA